jgi:peptidyl-prolyl cis-trans isomerase C
MKRSARALSALGIALASVLVAPPEHAAPGDAVAVTVGSSSLTVSDVARRMGGIPPFQLATYGKTPDEIRKNFVERVLVPELLHAEEARRQKLDAQPGNADRWRELLRQALENDLRETVESKEPVTPAEVAAYFAENRSRFETPPRIRLWRILVADEAQAKKTIELARGQEGPTRWTDAARQSSLDKATALRGGDLGFVRADGTTDVPRVRVDPALYSAAEKVKDGEVVAEPVREGNQWAAVWRRGSLPEIKRTIEQEQRSITQILTRKKLDDRRTALIDQLRKQHVRDVNDSLLDALEIKTFGDLGTPGRPGVVPRHGTPLPPAPSAGPQGLR